MSELLVYCFWCGRAPFRFVISIYGIDVRVYEVTLEKKNEAQCDVNIAEIDGPCVCVSVCVC